jgi:hypothetical protein
MGRAIRIISWHREVRARLSQEREMARRRKRVHRDWPAVIEAQSASGLSALAYCREQ